MRRALPLALLALLVAAAPAAARVEIVTKRHVGFKHFRTIQAASARRTRATGSSSIAASTTAPWSSRRTGCTCAG
ncbi:MAG TPA: hypothetical protein VH418_16875 [Solirubrobacteraceae bacterium]